jgi:hypothetical protein
MLKSMVEETAEIMSQHFLTQKANEPTGICNRLLNVFVLEKENLWLRKSKRVVRSTVSVTLG